MAIVMGWCVELVRPHWNKIQWYLLHRHVSYTDPPPCRYRKQAFGCFLQRDVGVGDVDLGTSFFSITTCRCRRYYCTYNSYKRGNLITEQASYPDFRVIRSRVVVKRFRVLLTNDVPL